MVNTYNLAKLPEWQPNKEDWKEGEPVRWSNFRELATPPAIGTRVHVRINQFGFGVVESYFVERGWLGVKVHLENPPAWHIKQNPGRGFCLVFGAEIESEQEGQRGVQKGR